MNKTANNTPAPPARVMMLGYDAAQILDIAGPLQLLSAAQRADGSPAYAIELVAPEAGPVGTTSGLTLYAHRGIDEISDDELKALDLFLVSGGQGSRVLEHDERVLTFIRRASAAASRTASICTGAILLAAAGVLDGKRATTHWAYAGKLARDYPKVTVDDDAIFVHDGDVWTSAGVTAGMDLALALVEHDLSREMALALARQHVMYLMRPGGQSQFSAQLAAQAVSDESIARVCSFIIENPREVLNVPQLASVARMSERTFARRFTQKAAMTPALFVERARLDEARRRLNESDLPLERIADEAGFGVSERMRRAFIRHLGVTPNRYRERFQTARRPVATTEEIHHDA